ncbi:hypothetical protein EBQ93_00225 [bacterium]|nr:hypothetical protein [bacterium]
MRQVFLNKNTIALKEVCEPVLHDYSILVSVYHSLVLPETENSIVSPFDEASIFKSIPEKLKNIFDSLGNSDIKTIVNLIKEHIYGNIKPLGHSCSGRVVAVGKKVTKFRTGDYVACIGSGFANHADFISVPEQFVTHVYNKSKLQEASFIAVGALAFDNTKQAHLQVGEFVVVVGLDLLGQLTAQIAKLSGCKVIGIDTNEFFLKTAQNLGIAYTLNPLVDNLEEEIQAITNQHQADCTIITKHFDQILAKSFDFTKNHGRIVLSQYDRGINLHNGKIALKSVQIINIPSYQPFEKQLSENHYLFDAQVHLPETQKYKSLASFIDFIEHDLLKINPLITHHLSINKVPEAFSYLERKNVLGVMLNYLPKPTPNITTDAPKKFIPAQKTGFHVGIIGSGNFSQGNIIPLLKRYKNTELTTIADANIANSLQNTKLYGAQKTVIKEFEVLKDDSIDIVFINSPHKYHAQHALEALQKNKAVFLDKPMATNIDQLEQLYQYSKQASVPLFVDYNKSSTSFARKIKTQISKRNSPLMLLYRMNAHFTPDELLQKKMGSGRVIGDACHVFDLFLYLMDCKPVSVSVESLHAKQDTIFPTENFSAQLSFEDGSVCTLFYTTLGNNQTTKERMEIYFDNKTILMNDYIQLEGYGLPLAFNEHVRTPQQGQKILLDAFFKSINQHPHHKETNLDRAYQATKITLLVDNLALKGGGEIELT